MHLSGVREGTFTNVGRSLSAESFAHCPFQITGDSAHFTIEKFIIEKRGLRMESGATIPDWSGKK